MRDVLLHFDFVSPYAWLGLANARPFAEKHGIRWDLRPVVYAKLLEANGLLGPAETEAKRRYTFFDVSRAAGRMELRWKGPPAHPFRSLEALRLAVSHRDQPQAIAALKDGLESGLSDQVLLGVTGSGKTFTMASLIAEVQRPALILAHNKTLAAQLFQEFSRLFPENAVEYFVSYYDYYQPEAYVPQSDTYIEKEATINEEIDRMRHAATSALFEPTKASSSITVGCLLAPS